MFRKRTLVGLDMGQYAIRCAVLEPDSGVVKSLLTVQTLPQRSQRGEDAGRHELALRLSEFAALYTRECGIFGKNFNVAVQGTSTVFKYLELPPLKPRELEVAVPSRAFKHIPFPADRVTISCMQVPPLSKGERKSTVFFIAEQNSVLNELRELVRGCGLNVQRIETPVLSLTRLFTRNIQFPADRLYVIVHSGIRNSYVIIGKEQYPYFAREFALAGRDLIYAFQMGAQISWNAAEEMLARYDVTIEDPAIEPFIAKWLDEVKRSVDYFAKQSRVPVTDIDSVFLTGGIAHVKGLEKRLHRHLSIPVTTLKADRIRVDEGGQRDDFADYSVAIGLALA